MKYLTTALFAALVMLPSAWAEPPANTDNEKKIEIAIDVESDDSVAETEQSIDKLVDKIIKKFDVDSTLSEEEKTHIKDEVHQAFEAAPKNIHIGGDNSVMGEVIGDNIVMGEVIGLFAVILIFGGPIIIVGIALYSSYKKRRLTHDTINKYVDSGKDIPVEVLEGLHKQTNPKSNLHKGLVMVGVGFGIFVCFLIIGSAEAGALGLIPLFIGLAQLLVWKLEKGGKNGLEQ